MQLVRKGVTPTHQIIAVFVGSALSFALADGATFAELADRLDQLGERHSGPPTAIYCKFSVSSQPIVQSPIGIYA
jgi:hypothetical protein